MHGPYPVMPRAPANDTRAIASIVLGVLSMTCLGFFAGIPAIVIGAMSRREIDRSQGALCGRGLAAGGIVTGLFGTGMSLVVLMALASGLLPSSSDSKAESPSHVAVAAGTRSYGSLDVVDLDTRKPLDRQLQEIAKVAATKDRVVVLQTYLKTSPECAEVAASLPDHRMQHALKNVTLVRVDVDAFQAPLEKMRVETESAPWFYRLDKNARPTDAISADEWDANIPENMAPVLGEFVRGVLRARRTASPLGTAL
jgi:hypothetical protein